MANLRALESMLAAALAKKSSTKRVTREKDPIKTEPLFYARSPEKIKFSKRGEEKYEEILRDDFAKQHGFIWSDSMFASPHLRDLIWQDTTHPKTALPKVEERLHNPLDCFVVFEKDQPKIGLGVRLAHDAKSLPEGIVIGCMAGELGSTIPFTKNPFTVGLFSDEHKDSIITDKISEPEVTSDRIRNLCALINDAPQPDELARAKVQASNAYNKNHIGGANVVIIPILHKGTPMCILMTAQPIMPGNELFWSFGPGFWDDEQRFVFDPQGNTIGYFNSKNEIILNPGEKKADRKKAPQIDLIKLKRVYEEVGASPIVHIPCDTFDAGKRFVFDVRYSLGVFEKRFEKNSPEGLLLEKIKAEFERDKNVKIRYNNLHAALSAETCKKLPPTLKAELVLHMKKYQATKPKPFLGREEKKEDKSQPVSAKASQGKSAQQILG